MAQPSTIRRIWLTIAPCATPGRIGLRLSPVPPADMADCMAVLMTRGDVPQGWPLKLDVVSDPTADPALRGLPGKNASAYLRTVTIGQTATVAIQAGVRRLAVPIPAALGVAAGDSLYLAPTKAIDGYALHDVVAVSPTSLSVGLTAPLLAIGASFAIPAKLFRFNT